MPEETQQDLSEYLWGKWVDFTPMDFQVHRDLCVVCFPGSGYRPSSSAPCVGHGLSLELCGQPVGQLCGQHFDNGEKMKSRSSLGQTLCIGLV